MLVHLTHGLRWLKTVSYHLCVSWMLLYLGISSRYLTRKTNLKLRVHNLCKGIIHKKYEIFGRCRHFEWAGDSVLNACGCWNRNTCGCWQWRPALLFLSICTICSQQQTKVPLNKAKFIPDFEHFLSLTSCAISQQSSNARKASPRGILTSPTEKATLWRGPSQQWTLPTAHSKVWKARATARNPTAGGSSGWHTALVMANSQSRSLTASVTCTQAAATLPAPVPHHNPTAHRLIFHRNSQSAQFSSEFEAPIWSLSNCAVPSAKRYVERYFSL